MTTKRPGASLHRAILKHRPALAAGSLALLLSACTATTAGSGGAGTVGGKVPQTREPSRTIPRDPQFQNLPGLEGVIGATEKQLVRQFGNPRLDVWEGDARKLQFTGTPCLLDVYLYPSNRSREPLATYVDARRASDGQDVDRAACVAALRGR